jgi:hypothetical protein
MLGNKASHHGRVFIIDYVHAYAIYFMLIFESKTYFIYLLQLRLNYICIISQAAKLARFKKFIFVRLLVVHEMFLLV